MYRFQLLQIPVRADRISRSLVLDIEDNGVRFRFDLYEHLDTYEGADPELIIPWED